MSFDVCITRRCQIPVDGAGECAEACRLSAEEEAAALRAVHVGGVPALSRVLVRLEEHDVNFRRE